MVINTVTGRLVAAAAVALERIESDRLDALDGIRQFIVHDGDVRKGFRLELLE